MMELSNCIALKVKDEEISLYDVLRLAKFTGQLQFIDEAIDAALIREAAASHGIEISNEELQEAADNFRLARDLHDSDSTDAWLETNHLSFEDWEVLLEEQLITQRLVDLLTESRIEQRFEEQRLAFDAVAISRIVVNEEGIARELRAQIVDDGGDFHALARMHSLDGDTKAAGGYAGLVHRDGLEAASEAAIFGAAAGKIVGPFKTDAGWELIKVEALHPAVLDDSMRETIKSLLFGEWLKERRLNVSVSIPLLEPSRETIDEESVVSTPP